MKRTSAATGGALAGIATGTRRADPAHSSVTFAVRHLMSKVRGRFRLADGKIVVGQALASCSVEASIATASADTGVQMRDDDLRSPRRAAKSSSVTPSPSNSTSRRSPNSDPAGGGHTPVPINVLEGPDNR